MAAETPSCELCNKSSGRVLWQDALCHVVLLDAEEARTDYPGFCRVIWNAHVKEMTDLNPADRQHFMTVVFATEAALRSCLQPYKINLASLGNQVPHLHWHVIPRWQYDRHFPNPIWGKVERSTPPLLVALDLNVIAEKLQRTIEKTLAENPEKILVKETSH